MTHYEEIDALLEALNEDEMSDHPEDSSLKIITVNSFRQIVVDLSGGFVNAWWITDFGNVRNAGVNLAGLLRNIKVEFAA